MLTAAAAWETLATELGSAASAFGSVISGLTSEEWLGAGSKAMAAAATPYVAWMSETAVQAEQTAAQARAAAGAYENAFSATVPPPLIAANRAQLRSLIATNLFGQNSPAIAATEAQYAEMWAQDAGAMYDYAGASSTAATMTPFAAPPQTTNVGAEAGQPNAVGTSAESSAQTAASTIPQLTSTSTLPQALQQLSSPTSASTSPLSWLVQQIDGVSLSNRSTLFSQTKPFYLGEGIGQFGVSIGQQLIPGSPGGAGAAGSSPLAPGGWSGLGGLGGGGAVSGTVGQAGTIGRLSVPPSWAAAAPPASPTASVAPISSISAAPKGGTNGLLRGLPRGGLGRRSAGGYVHKYGFRHTVMPHSPGAG